MLHAVSLASVFYVFWLLLSGHFNPLLLSLGVASVLLVVYLAHRMDAVDHGAHPLNLTVNAPAYWLWLLIEATKSNVDVVRRIWQRHPQIAPCMVRLNTSQDSALGRVIYAHSITLNPGTVVTDVLESEIEVHALTSEAADALQEGDMDRRVSHMCK